MKANQKKMDLTSIKEPIKENDVITHIILDPKKSKIAENETRSLHILKIVYCILNDSSSKTLRHTFTHMSDV